MCWDPQREGGIENLPSQQMCPPQLSLWASLSAFWLAFGSFYIRHSESSNSEMPKRILVVLEAMDIRGTSCGHLPSLPTSMIHLLGSWASTGNKKKKKKGSFPCCFFLFLFDSRESPFVQSAVWDRISFICAPWCIRGCLSGPFRPFVVNWWELRLTQAQLWAPVLCKEKLEMSFRFMVKLLGHGTEHQAFNI